jgi:limonene-1,2-epoxide hydrolase
MSATTDPSPVESGTHPEDVVRGFCEAWLGRHLDTIMSFVTEDFEYHNIPVPVARGHAEVRPIFEYFLAQLNPVHLEIVNMFSTGNQVFTERVDHMTSAHGHVDLPVGGYFEVRDGRIAVMHEYFDLQTFVDDAKIPLG